MAVCTHSNHRTCRREHNLRYEYGTSRLPETQKRLSCQINAGKKSMGRSFSVAVAARALQMLSTVARPPLDGFAAGD